MQFGFQPLVLYRQHGRNQIGANRGAWAAIKHGFWMLTGRLSRWNGMNIATLQASAFRLSGDNRALLEAFASWRGRGFLAGPWLAACLGKI